MYIIFIVPVISQVIIIKGEAEEKKRNNYATLGLRDMQYNKQCDMMTN
jgi:hypothetical protein